MMKKDYLLEQLKQNPFVLAPMAAITDCPFRSFMKRQGAGILITELVSATGLRFQSQKTWDLMRFTEEQRPIGIQIFGDNIEDLSNAAKIVEQTGANFVDLNFGCPVPKIVKKGGGAGALRDLNKLAQIIKSVVKSVNIPVTIKIRTGWNEKERNTDEVVKIAYNEGITWVTIHGRTRAQGYEGLADWDYIKYIKSLSKIPIIGNGDIIDPFQAVYIKLWSKCDGIMIGRGALKDPFIFKKSHLLLKEGKDYFSSLNINQMGYKNFIKSSLHHLLIEKLGYLIDDKENYVSLINELLCLYNQFYLNSNKLLEIQFKKLIVWFSTGFPHASDFRKKIFQAQNVQEVQQLAIAFFENLNMTIRKNQDNMGFLMGGHG